MKPRTYFRLSVILAAAGTAFAGYLSAVRAQRGVCAFDEACPFFLGHPACYTGFALFLTLLALSAIGLLGKRTWPIVANLVVATCGVAFAGLMTIPEVRAHTHYKMGLPTCAYGFVFFAAVLVASLIALVKRPRG